MAGGRAVVFSEDERADSSAGVGGRGRLSAVELRLPALSGRGRGGGGGGGGPAVELRLPELSWRARADAAGAGAQSGVRGREHRRHLLGAAQLLARDPPADRGV